MDTEEKAVGCVFAVVIGYVCFWIFIAGLAIWGIIKLVNWITSIQL